MIKACGQIKSQSIGGSEVLYGVTVITVDFLLGILFTYRFDITESTIMEFFIMWL